MSETDRLLGPGSSGFKECYSHQTQTGHYLGGEPSESFQGAYSGEQAAGGYPVGQTAVPKCSDEFSKNKDSYAAPSEPNRILNQEDERHFYCSVPKVTEEEAREALLEFVADHCCYGTIAAEQLTFHDLQPRSAFHYTIESYTESRCTDWAYEPYTGQRIDGPDGGPAPGPWDIQTAPSKMFEDEIRQIEVPHTASVKPCHHCLASGFIRCHRCKGQGRNRCFSCNGSGRSAQNSCCRFCYGFGFNNCEVCYTQGKIVCPLCMSNRSLKCFILLKITWHTYQNHHVVERTDLPDELIKQAKGRLVFDETMPRVQPITQFQESEVNQASANLVAQHQFPDAAIIMQRQRVRIVPVTVCQYRWYNKDYDFIVYGFEKKAYAPNYPQKCCCGLCITC